MPDDYMYYLHTCLYQQMFKENIENFLAGPDNKYGAVEAHKPTMNRFADQETQVGMAGPYTAKII